MHGAAHGPRAEMPTELSVDWLVGEQVGVRSDGSDSAPLAGRRVATDFWSDVRIIGLE